MSVKCDGCGKEVKPQVVRQVGVVGEGGRGGANKDWKKPGVKTLIRKTVQLSTHPIYSIFYWVFGTATPTQYLLPDIVRKRCWLYSDTFVRDSMHFLKKKYLTGQGLPNFCWGVAGDGWQKNTQILHVQVLVGRGREAWPSAPKMRLRHAADLGEGTVSLTYTKQHQDGADPQNSGQYIKLLQC